VCEIACFLNLKINIFVRQNPNLFTQKILRAAYSDITVKAFDALLTVIRILEGQEKDQD